MFSEIKAVLFDVDGVLTDGSVFIDSCGNQAVNFNVRDGQLIAFMQRNGFIFGAISGRQSCSVAHRLDALGIDFVRLGIHDKSKSLREFQELYAMNIRSVCYIGDDIIDLQVLKAVGLSVCPSDGIQIVRDNVDYIANAPGGRGVLREVIDMIISGSQDLTYQLSAYYGHD